MIYESIQDVITHAKIIATNNNIDVKIDVNNDISHLAVCKNRKEIYFSKHYLSALIQYKYYNEIEELILHELGHAKAPKHSYHNFMWIKVVQDMGGHPTRLASLDFYLYKYVYQCPVCGKIIKRRSKIRKGYGHCKKDLVLIKEYDDYVVEKIRKAA